MDTRAAVEPAAIAHRALLAHRSAVLLRRLGPGDRSEIEALHRDLPRDGSYLRFFTMSRTTDEEFR